VRTIIKAGDDDARTVRSLSGPILSAAAGRERPSEDELDGAAVLDEVDLLTEQARHHEREILRLRKECSEAYRNGEAEGRKNGLREASDRSRERLGALRAAVEAAMAKLACEMASLERLSVLIAHEALERVLGDATNHAELVTEIIGKVLAGLEADSTLAVLVARADFADADAVAELAASRGWPGLAISPSDALASGDCQIRLTLGGLEVGVNQQWGALKATLHELAQPDAHP
jgi:flagellar biosynthesis/type III secretory pathway protein FliH